jgi:hypothetical protein
MEQTEKQINLHEVDLAIVNEIAEDYGALKPTGFNGDADWYDKAIIGLSNNGQLVYSKEWMVKLLMESENTDLSEEDAWEYLEYNCFGAYLGEQTPIFVNTYQGFIN